MRTFRLRIKDDDTRTMTTAEEAIDAYQTYEDEKLFDDTVDLILAINDAKKKDPSVRMADICQKNMGIFIKAEKYHDQLDTLRRYVDSEPTATEGLKDFFDDVDDFMDRFRKSKVMKALRKSDGSDDIIEKVAKEDYAHPEIMIPRNAVDSWTGAVVRISMITFESDGRKYYLTDDDAPVIKELLEPTLVSHGYSPSKQQFTTGQEAEFDKETGELIEKDQHVFNAMFVEPMDNTKLAPYTYEESHGVLIRPLLDINVYKPLQEAYIHGDNIGFIKSEALSAAEEIEDIIQSTVESGGFSDKFNATHGTVSIKTRILQDNLSSFDPANLRKQKKLLEQFHPEWKIGKRHANVDKNAKEMLEETERFDGVLVAKTRMTYDALKNNLNTLIKRIAIGSINHDAGNAYDKYCGDIKRWYRSAVMMKDMNLPEKYGYALWYYNPLDFMKVSLYADLSSADEINRTWDRISKDKNSYKKDRCVKVSLDSLLFNYAIRPLRNDIDGPMSPSKFDEKYVDAYNGQFDGYAKNSHAPLAKSIYSMNIPGLQVVPEDDEKRNSSSDVNKLIADFTNEKKNMHKDYLESLKADKDTEFIKPNYDLERMYGKPKAFYLKLNKKDDAADKLFPNVNNHELSTRYCKSVLTDAVQDVCINWGIDTIHIQCLSDQTRNYGNDEIAIISFSYVDSQDDHLTEDMRNQIIDDIEKQGIAVDASSNADYDIIISQVNAMVQELSKGSHPVQKDLDVPEKTKTEEPKSEAFERERKNARKKKQEVDLNGKIIMPEAKTEKFNPEDKLIVTWRIDIDDADNKMSARDFMGTAKFISSIMSEYDGNAKIDADKTAKRFTVTLNTTYDKFKNYKTNLEWNELNKKFQDFKNKHGMGHFDIGASELVNMKKTA